MSVRNSISFEKQVTERAVKAKIERSCSLSYRELDIFDQKVKLWAKLYFTRN
jgi:hypothetical protein